MIQPSLIFKEKIQLQFFYMISPLIKTGMPTRDIIYEYRYSISSVLFQFIEIYNIVFIADAIEKEVFLFLKSFQIM